MYPNLFCAQILLVENNLINQEIAVEFLEKAGASVYVAQNGAEAINILRKDHFDCVLMDIQMPVMDGFEATRIIRADAALAEIPVIAMTASTSHEDRENCIAAGFNDFISKPFRLDTLYATLDRWLVTQPQQATSPVMTPMLTASVAWAGDPNIIDLSMLTELIGDNKLEMREFALEFMASARQDLTTIEDALERNDLATLGTLGHHNRTPAIMVGAIGYADLCRALELGKDSANLDQARDTVSQMRPLLELIMEQIDRDLA